MIAEFAPFFFCIGVAFVVSWIYAILVHLYLRWRKWRGWGKPNWQGRHYWPD